MSTIHSEHYKVHLSNPVADADKLGHVSVTKLGRVRSVMISWP